MASEHISTGQSIYGGYYAKDSKEITVTVKANLLLVKLHLLLRKKRTTTINLCPQTKNYH
ncbi:MAG: hypothetical protein F6K10_05735 [Moorea sp. SIO2B7]|nr:hypothetical protein [Moorena sp. SIO2B7]